MSLEPLKVNRKKVNHVEIFAFLNSPRNIPLYFDSSDRNLAQARGSLLLFAPPAPFAKNTEQEEIFAWGCCQDREAVKKEVHCLSRNIFSGHRASAQCTKRKAIKKTPICKSAQPPRERGGESVCPLCRLSALFQSQELQRSLFCHLPLT